MADLRGYVTATGQQFEALAKQMGYPVIIGKIQIGDGVLPDSESPIARTQLVNPIASFPAIVEQDPKNPGQWVASIHIPPDHAINGAGYFIREIGCQLINQGEGVLYAYRRVSNDWKPVDTSGEAKSFIYKLRFIPSNGELLKPTIDPSVVLVDREELDRVMKAHKESRDHPDATEQAKGFTRYASQPQTDAGAADDASVTPKKLKASLRALGLTGIGSALIGVPIDWPLAQMPQDIWPDCGMTFLSCAGQGFNKVTYPKLAQAYPSGVIPEIRAEFIRGWDNGRGVDPGREILSAQAQSMQSHNHSWLHRYFSSGGSLVASDVVESRGPGYGGTDMGGASLKTGTSGGTETRPCNIAFHKIMRAA